MAKIKRKRDTNELAFQITQLATGNTEEVNLYAGKNPAAVELGRLGGLVGGKARDKKLSKKKKSAIAKKAAKARWGKK